MKEQTGNDTLTSEIGEAIQTMNAENETQVEKETPAPKAEVEAPAPDKGGAGEEAFTADDALIERAVKAGLSVADAKAFASADQADRILKALESKRETPKTGAEAAADAGDEGFPTAEFDNAIKEMEDDGDYDPKFIKLFKSMSGLLKDQSNTIKALKAAGQSAAAETVFDKSFGGLDKAVRDHIDAATKSQLKKKFDFLKAAHKSADDGATDEDIFGEARKLVLGDIESRYAEENKAEEIAKRKALALARPGGESGRNGTDRPATEEDVANILFNQLTK